MEHWKALARAWRWQRMLDKGDYSSVSEIGGAENISKDYISRILRAGAPRPLTLSKRFWRGANGGLMLERLERPLSAN